MIRHYLIIYDITDNKRLQKIAKIMEDYGERIQRSVFEIEIREKFVMDDKEEYQIL